MKKILALLAIAGMLNVLQAAPALAAYSFGTDPYNDVISAASSARTNYGITDATINELAAMMLAVTWEETGAGQSGAPSPMTLGRWDGPWVNSKSSALWPFKDVDSSTPRAFFHAGVGMWQLDSAGMGANLGAEAMIYSNSSAQVVANHVASVWKNTSGTKASRRSRVWGAWYACSDGSCETVFNTIYNASIDTLNVTLTTSVDRYGGAVWKTCYNAYGSWSCLKVDPTLAQGYTSSWRMPPLDGDPTSGPSPLTYTFYVWSGSIYEYRFWHKKSTNYTTNFFANRQMGSDVRDTIDWSNTETVCTDLGC